eukprot:TRINITY_DN10424_c0_g1_i1.p1 TRINITY_DN10424_c0_g1~~TRINITY_DN10424_c0_g1_i1.p1  ORF type:complete len:112 (+),score=13.61 TRINITY_DN10424_c0_g1_i1:165-500(+)
MHALEWHMQTKEIEMQNLSTLPKQNSLYNSHSCTSFKCCKEMRKFDLMPLLPNIALSLRGNCNKIQISPPYRPFSRKKGLRLTFCTLRSIFIFDFEAPQLLLNIAMQKAMR